MLLDHGSAGYGVGEPFDETTTFTREGMEGGQREDRGPNSACDVGLPLGLTSGLGRDRGESGGLRGVLVAPARHREKLGQLSTGIVESGRMLVRSRELRWRGKSGGQQGN